MKKVFTLVAVASLSLVACGPSAEEVAAKAKLVADSVTAYTNEMVAAEAAKAQAMQDSINTFTAAAEAEAKRVTDSIEAAKSKPGKPAAKPTKPKGSEVKAGQGKG